MPNFFDDLYLEARKEAIEDLKQEFLEKEDDESLKALNNKIEDLESYERVKI